MFNTVTRDLKDQPGVVASVLRFSARTAEAFVRRVAVVIREGESLSATVIVLLQLIVARLMELRRDELVEAETFHRAELRKLARLRMRRDDDNSVLYGTLLRTRTSYDGAHGTGASELYLGLESGMRNLAPYVLLRQARGAMDVFLDPEAELPEAVPVLTSQDRAAFEEQIRGPMEALETTMKAFEEQKRETEEALRLKNEAAAATRKVNVYGGRILEGIYMLAGEEFHAVRLRGLIGGRTISETLEDTPPAGDVPAGDQEAVVREAADQEAPDLETPAPEEPPT